MSNLGNTNELAGRRKIVFELLGIFLVCGITYLFAGRYDLFGRLVAFSSRHQSLHLDEHFIAALSLAVLLGFFCFKRIRELLKSRQGLLDRNRDLKLVLDELTQSRATLADREEYIRLLLDSAAEAIFGIDQQGRCTFSNRACLEMLGYGREEDLLGQKIHELIHHTRPDGTPYPSAECAVHTSFRQRRQIHVDNEILWRADGSSFPAEYWAHPILQDNEVTGAVVTFLDISRRRKIESELAQREREYRTVLENSPAIVQRYDRNLRRLYVNPAWERMTGLSAGDVVQKTPSEIASAPESIVSGYVAELRKVLETGAAHTLTFPWVNTRGEKVYLEYRIVPEFGSKGEITSLLAVGLDISERRHIEETLRKTLNFTESLLAQSPLGIRVFEGGSGLCIRANQAAEIIAGGPVAELLQQNFRGLDSWRSAGLINAAETVLADGEARQVEAELVTTFGKDLVARYFFSRFSVDEKPHLLVLGQDISDEKRLAEEKRSLEEKMLHTQKLESLGVLAGGIAHDFNNILMAVLGNADLALRRVPAESPAVIHLKQIHKAAEQAADLAGQMLAYSGRGKFVVESLDLNKLIDAMMHMLEVSISKKAHLRFELSQHLPAVEADATQLRQVIMNLVINASEAIGEKSGVIAISTGVMDCDSWYLSDTWLDESLPGGLYVYFEIADTGCGMDQETTSRIFDPFFTTKFAGRGLGMAAVLGIIRGHKGAIKVYSEVGKGTTFKILLPAASRPAALFDMDEPEPGWAGSGKVLLVDDEDTVRAVGKTMLEELGFEVLIAVDGREALAVFRDDHADIRLVVMDLTMPHMGGEEAYREMRRISPEVKVIITSGYNEQEVSHRFVGKGLAGFLQKPFRISALQKALREIGIGNPP